MAFDNKFYGSSILFSTLHCCCDNQNTNRFNISTRVATNKNQAKLRSHSRHRIVLISWRRYYHYWIYLLCGGGFYDEMKEIHNRSQKIACHKILTTRKRWKCLAPYHLIEMFITQDFPSFHARLLILSFLSFVLDFTVIFV